ncbi:hypothetical protein EV1_021012 [Malus domestica]|uniref:uncharacterized protein LOC126608005 n=1 Tax=Malus sylvestris TaxID=3752 RepID=UPI0021ACB614|nr:uncharacterized protein LOC126608005 [Malus sylvestris]
MLKPCIQLLGLARNPDSRSKRNKQLTAPFVDDRSEVKEVDAASISLDLRWCSKDVFLLRIVHAGGREELYQNVVPASQLMEKYPGMCVARPEVFKNPQEALLRPEESLLVGQKYYMIPSTTAHKIKKKHQKKLMAEEAAERKEEAPDAKITVDSGRSDTDDSVCSAKEYYGSKERWSKCKRRKNFRGKKPFVPPLPRTSSCRGINWEPSLTSVQELSP